MEVSDSILLSSVPPDPPLAEIVPEELYLDYPGPPARLSLRTFGTPTPTVQWYFSSSRTGLEVPIRETGPNSRYVVSQSGSLVVMETSLADEGVYRAVVSNGAGETQVEAILEFFFRKLG